MRNFSRFGLVVFLGVPLMTPSCWARVWNVNEVGARGDKLSNDTAVIQKALDNAAQAGGGMVYIPAGNYRCGPL